MTAGRAPDPRELIWVEPALAGPSGGAVYNERVIQALRASGVTVHRLTVAGSWPRPRDADRRALIDRLTVLQTRCGAVPVVVDGLVGGCLPELFTADAGSPRAQVLLVHLPLGAEDEAPAEPGHAARTIDPADPAAPAESAADLVRLERRAVQAAERVVATSSWAAVDLQRRHGRAAAEVIVPGVDHPDSRDLPRADDGGEGPGREQYRTSRPHRLTVAASFTPRKNHRLLGEALQDLLHLDWILQLAGPGAEGPCGAAVLEELHRRLPGRVELLGAFAPARMPALWDRTDLVLLPSWAETFGMVVTEACAHGVPAVVSSGTGAVEALGAVEGTASGPAGAVADPRRPAQWTELLETWMTDPGLRGQWAAAARARADRLPPWTQTATAWRRLTASVPTG